MYFRISKKKKISLSAHYNIFFQNKKIFRDFFLFNNFLLKSLKIVFFNFLENIPKFSAQKKLKKLFNRLSLIKISLIFFHFFFQKNSHHKKDLEKQYYEKILRFKTSKNYFFHLMTKKNVFHNFLSIKKEKRAEFFKISTLSFSLFILLDVLKSALLSLEKISLYLDCLSVYYNILLHYLYRLFLRRQQPY